MENSELSSCFWIAFKFILASEKHYASLASWLQPAMNLIKPQPTNCPLLSLKAAQGRSN